MSLERLLISKLKIISLLFKLACAGAPVVETDIKDDAPKAAFLTANSKLKGISLFNVLEVVSFCVFVLVEN